ERVRRGDAGGQGPRDRRRGGPAGPGRRPRRVPLDRRASPGRRRMLSEEALILIAVVGAWALLIPGVLETLWPSRPRHPGPRSPPAPLARPAPATNAPAPMPPAPPPMAQTPPVPETVEPEVAAPEVSGPAVKPEPPPESVAATVAAPEPPPATPFEPPRRPAPGTTLRIDPLLVERCFSLYQDRQHDEVVSTGEEALGRLGDAPLSTREAREAAALWSVVALAKQALGDDIGASMALESALRVAPADEGMTYRQHIAALAQSAA